MGFAAAVLGFWVVGHRTLQVFGTPTDLIFLSLGFPRYLENVEGFGLLVLPNNGEVRF